MSEYEHASRGVFVGIILGEFRCRSGTSDRTGNLLTAYLSDLLDLEKLIETVGKMMPCPARTSIETMTDQPRRKDGPDCLRGDVLLL